MAKRGCTQCGNCFNVCPVYSLIRREEVSPKAKHGLMDEGWKEHSRLNWSSMLRLANFCASCGRCASICPRHLSVPERLNQTRARRPGWQQRFWKLWIGGRKVFWPAAKYAAPLWPHSLLPEKLACMQNSALAMKEPARTAPWLRLADASRPLEGLSVVLFGGCTAERLRPVWIEKASALLARLGAHVLSAKGFGCCGGTFNHAGLPEAASEAASANAEVWRTLGRPVVATICASCLHGLKDYPHLGGVLAEAEAADWTAKVVPLSSLLGKAAFEPCAAAPAAYAYHSPCHWLPGKDEDMAWLKRVLPGMRKGSALCCGFGGVLQIMNPGLSRDLAAKCWDGLDDAAEVITGCSGCTLQLASHAPQGASVRHWLDVVDV